ncbi:DUF4355 domain-containing protein [Holzapfeliella sp. He02]|uniref:DUF4355 domain-containing protein n=1 Tax=Holzapfeliella saturejae TaxID=3082953 RepID=A0ABU8SHG2_9LACO
MEETQQNIESVEEEATDQVESEETEQQEESKEQEQSYSQEDVDNIVKKALSNFQEEQKAKIEEEKKVAKMSADEKYKYQLEKAKEDADNARKELKQRDNRDLVRTLAEKQGVSVTQDDVKFLATADEEETQQKASYFIERIKQAYSDGKDSTIKSSAPKLTAEKNSKTMTKEDILAIEDPEERNRLMTENYNLFI